MSSAAALVVKPAPVRLRAPACIECGYLRGLLAEQRAALTTLSVVVCAVIGAQRAQRVRAQREAFPPVDLAAERVVLGMALERAEAPQPELFAGPTHRELASAIRTGELAPVLLAPEMRGYRRGLCRVARRATIAQKTAACDALLAAAERRAALAAAERAVDALRSWAPTDDAADELRRALALVEAAEPQEGTEPW